MIIDSHRVIRKLDERSVISFLQRQKNPLVVYGVGKAGKRALDVLQKFDISVDAVVDGAKEKQGADIGDFRISQARRYCRHTVIHQISRSRIRFILALLP